MALGGYAMDGVLGWNQFLHVSQGTSTYEKVVDSQALYTIET